MKAPGESFTPEFFEEFYAKNPDPWRFKTSPYEREKYAATLNALPRERYESAFELGCSIGVLTRLLAPRCARLLAVDGAEAPLAEARENLAEMPWVEIRRAHVPADWPEGGSFDLILLSEVLYFLNPADLHTVTDQALRALRPGGDVVLVHWLPPAEPPFPQTGDEAVQGFLARAGDALQPLVAQREEQYRLDVLRRA
ncbi:class I SAM-dependent methyltransferase [Pararoseomonas sp. SCSIO 73927]|uniref:class I SAM-dependent DNA methyltransferase n=1 Tax=Pararoseomonas sp. SCSIO 73927 TaxID=3114537 RepID=UPI0030CFE86B